MDPDIGVPCTYDPTLDVLYAYLVTDEIFAANYTNSTTKSVTLTVTIDLDSQGNAIGVEIPDFRDSLA